MLFEHEEAAKMETRAEPRSAIARCLIAALAAVAVALCGASASAATTALDARFGTSGVAAPGPTASGLDLLVFAIAIQGDGRLVVAGRAFPTPSGYYEPAVGRLNPDGSWDTTFADNGLFVLDSTVAPVGGELKNVALFSDGRIVAAGAARTGNGFTRYYSSCVLLLKLDALGVADTSFAPDHSGSSCVDLEPATTTTFPDGDLRVDSDDTFVVTTSSASLDHGVVARFDASGMPVTSFGSSGIAALASGLYGTRLQLLANHETLVAAFGVVDAASSTWNIAATLLSAAGQPDVSYGVDGILTWNQATANFTWPASAARDAQDRIVVGDNDFSATNPIINRPYRIARLTQAGTLDATFNGNAQQPGYAGFAFLPVSADATTDYLVSALPLPDGHLVVVGNAGRFVASDGQSDIAVLRLNDDASYDASFGDALHPGWASINLGGADTSNGTSQAAAIDSRGRLFIAGRATDSAGKSCTRILRLIPDRLFEGCFDPAAPYPDCP